MIITYENNTKNGYNMKCIKKYESIYIDNRPTDRKTDRQTKRQTIVVSTVNR